MSTRQVYLTFLLSIILARIDTSSIDSSAHSSSSHEAAQKMYDELIQEDEKPEPAPAKKRPLKSLGLFDNRYDKDTTIVSNLKEEEPKRDIFPELDLKELRKKKHRVIHDVEIAQRNLIDQGLQTATGELDTKSILKLINAEHSRANNPDRTQTGYRKIWTLEELDRKYRTPEGDRRLGIVSDEQVKAVLPKERWRKTSHFVNIGKPGAKKEILPDYTLNYNKKPIQVDIIIESSIGCHYLLRVNVKSSIRDLKYTIWEQEAYFRYNYSDFSKADKARGYDIKKQILFCNGLDLQKVDSDSSLEFVGIQNFSIIHVVEKLKLDHAMITNLSSIYGQFAWKRAKNKKCLASIENEMVLDEDQLLHKAYYLAAEEFFKNLTEFLPGFNFLCENISKDYPDLGDTPNPFIDEDHKDKAWEMLCKMESPNYLREKWELVEKAFDETRKLGNASVLNVNEKDLEHVEDVEQKIREELEQNELWADFFMSMPDLQEAAIKFHAEYEQKRAKYRPSNKSPQSWIDLEFPSNTSAQNDYRADEDSHEEFEIQQEYYELAKEAWKKESLLDKGKRKELGRITAPKASKTKD